MHGIAKHKRKVTPEIAVIILSEYATRISLEEADLILEFMYDFARLAVNQQLQHISEGQDPLIRHPGPG